MATSPTQRTLAHCRKLGWTIDVAEYWLPPRGDMPHGRRRDLFGCIDLMAVTPRGVLAIQATSGSNTNARVRKSTDECGEFLQQWLRWPNVMFEVWGWTKYKRPVARKLWRPRRVAIVLRAGQLETRDLGRLAARLVA